MPGRGGLFRFGQTSESSKPERIQLETGQLSDDAVPFESSPMRFGGGSAASALGSFASGFTAGIHEAVQSAKDDRPSSVTTARQDNAPEKESTASGDQSGSPTKTPMWRIDRFLAPPQISLPVKQLAASVIGRRQSPLRWRHPDEAAADLSVPKGSFAPEALSILFGADSIEGHYRRIGEALSAARGLYGSEGLHAMGFEFRLVPCEGHRHGHRSECGSTTDINVVKDGDGSGSHSFMSMESSPVEDERKIKSQARERSYSDPLLSSLLHDSSEYCAQHLLEIMPSHLASVGDIVESAEIRQRKVRGFANNNSHESEISMGPVDFDQHDEESTCIGNGNKMKQPNTITGGKNVTVSQKISPELFPEVSLPTKRVEVRDDSSLSMASCSIRSDVTHMINGNEFERSDLPSVNEHKDERGSGSFCQNCITRLFHVESSTLITGENRVKFIADGDMYEEVARLIQENVHEIMVEEGDLEWVTVCDDQTKGDTVRALVNKGHVFPGHTTVERSDGGRETGAMGSESRITMPVKNEKNIDEQEGLRKKSRKSSMWHETRPTLLIATGKGKVRAGVFSRQHLITSGLEPSTALPMVREARRRGMGVVLLDPNARSDKLGLETLSRSVVKLFGDAGQGDEMDVDFPSSSETKSHKAEPLREHHGNPLYILAYSAAGGHLVRYLINAANPFIQRVQAIVFVDSTHNIQWARHFPHLSSLLESPSCLYIRSADTRRDGFGATDYRAGDEIRTDSHWRRRFGALKTLSAGAAGHALATWAVHAQIWEHFDHVGMHLCEK